MIAPRQLPLPLPVRTARGRADFFVAPANAVAVATIDSWQAWPGGKCVLTGPEGAGKSHLAHVWADMARARVVEAAALPGADLPGLASRPVCVEDVDRIAGNLDAEEALFHLHNLVLAEGHALLVTGRTPPARWGLHLPDLCSRMMGAQTAALPRPDDTLLEAVLVKLFSDRQIVPPADVLRYLVARMPRSYRAAQALVAALDARSLARKTGVTRPLAAEALAALEAEEPDAAS